MSDITIGHSIYNSVKLLEQAGSEINTLLYDVIKQKVNKIIEDSNCGIVGYNWGDDSRVTDSGWGYSDCAISLELKKAGKGNHPVRYFVVQVSLFGDGVCLQNVNNKEPLVHVGLFSEKPRFDDYYCTLEDLNADLCIQNNILWNWYPSVNKFHEQMWMYSLRLTDLNSIHDVERKIIFPFFNNPFAPEDMLQALINETGIALYKKNDDEDSYNIEFIK